MGMVGEACLPSNAYYPRTPDYTLCSGVHVCWSEHSDSSFVYGFMILDNGFGTMTATTCSQISTVSFFFIFSLCVCWLFSYYCFERPITLTTTSETSMTTATSMMLVAVKWSDNWNRRRAVKHIKVQIKHKEFGWENYIRGDSTTFPRPKKKKKKKKKK